MNRSLFLNTILIVCMSLSGCVFKDDPEELTYGTSGDGDSDSDSDTDADTATDSHTSTDSATTTDSGTESNGSDESDSTSDTRTDSDRETETATDTNSDTIIESGTDTSSDSASDTLVVEDTDTGENCTVLTWECGTGSNSKGVLLDCDAEIGCESGSRCNEHACVSCNTDSHCGESCAVCGENGFVSKTRCFDDTDDTDFPVCVQCLTDADCPVDRPNCDPELHECFECFTNAHCRPDTEIIQIVATDSDTGTDMDTDSDTSIDTNSATAGPDTDTAYIRDTEHPWKSPLGVCTPDNTCTCWVPTPDSEVENIESELMVGCMTNSECPSDEYNCLRDYYDDTPVTPLYHLACLRLCDAGEEGQISAGLECRSFDGTVFAWIPMTTCFAFSKIYDDCSSQTFICSVDGNGNINDAACLNGKCTYRCDDDNWCPESSSGCGAEFSTCLP